MKDYIKNLSPMFLAGIAIMALIIFTLFMAFKISGFLNYYEAVDKDFQLKMTKKIEILQSGNDEFDREKTANLMKVALMRDFEHGIIFIQHKLLWLLLSMLFLSTATLIFIDYLRRKSANSGSD